MAYFCGKEVVERVLSEEALFEKFLELYERFDREILPEGRGRSGGRAHCRDRAPEAKRGPAISSEGVKRCPFRSAL